MAVFFVYLPDGGPYTSADMEYSPNAENVRRQLADRVRTGKGIGSFVERMEEIGYRAMRDSSVEDEWPPATDRACMVVWRCRENEIPGSPPTEVWHFSGNIDKPRITPVGQAEGEGE